MVPPQPMTQDIGLTLAPEPAQAVDLRWLPHLGQILRGEFAGVGAGAPGPRATDMLTIDRPDLDWTSLARGMGIEATRAEDLSQFASQLARAIAHRGPSLIEVWL